MKKETKLEKKPEKERKTENRISKTMQIPFPPDNTDRLMDMEEVRLRLGVSAMATVIALTNSGELPFIRMGARKLVRKVIFNKYLKKLEEESKGKGKEMDIRKMAKESGYYGAGEFKGRRKA